jgi:exodeoxyribonuclease VII small subunit
MNLEELFAKLEETITRLEQDELSLEEAFKEYEQGMKMLKECNAAIDKVEKKVLMITAEGETIEF